MTPIAAASLYHLIRPSSRLFTLTTTALWRSLAHLAYGR